MAEFFSWTGWNAVAAIGQVVAAIVTLITLWWAVRIAEQAKNESQQTKRASLQNSRLIGASLRAIAIAISKGNRDTPTDESIRSVEMIVEEMEKDFHRDSA